MTILNEILFLSLFLIITLGSFILSIRPWVDLYIKKGYTKKDAYKIVIKSIWKL